jgi:hypothetical protein
MRAGFFPARIIYSKLSWIGRCSFDALMLRGLYFLGLWIKSTTKMAD